MINDNRNVTAQVREASLSHGVNTRVLGFVAFYKWSKDMKKLTIQLDVNIPNVGVEFENITICPGIPSSQLSSKSMATMFGIHHSYVDPVSKLELTLDDKFKILSGKKSKSLARNRP